MRRDFLKLCTLIGLGFACLGGLALLARAADADDKAALEVGRKVLAVQRALANPKAPDAIKAITALGHDSRHYVMVRGWLVQELAGVKSIAEAQRGKAPAELAGRIAFLQKAVRAIDLE